jgi:hypothetical protein
MATGESMKTCPNCGYCPHCGRSAQPVYPPTFVPYWPPTLPVYPSPWWQVPPMGPTWTTGTITAGDNVTYDLSNTTFTQPNWQ